MILSVSLARMHKQGMGGGGGMMGGGMATIHELFASREQISRTVENLENGVETFVESENETIAGVCNLNRGAKILDYSRTR